MRTKADTLKSMLEDDTQTLNDIAYVLLDIPVEDMSKAEKQIYDILVRVGHLS
jgi:tyrosine-protein phosphatase YwqE